MEDVRKGIYNGKRIVSEEYVQMATSVQQMNREGGLWLLTCPISKMFLMICWKVWREIYLKSGEGLGGRTKMPPLLCMSSTLRR